MSQVKLKDHSIFFHDGYYYIISIHIPLPSNDATAEKTFIHARTADFCHWELRGTVLTIGNPGDADENRIWAPYVIAEGDTYYLFYTGANNNIAQSIMLATSQTPEDPASWVKQGVVFQPNHAGMVYAGPTEWSDGRDAMVLSYNGRYYLYYTGRDNAGPIVGVAVSDHLAGPWEDLGAVVTERDTGAYFESPFVLERAGYYYLFYNASLPGEPAREEWRWAPSPFGPWQAGAPVGVGWAHEFIGIGETWYSSFLIGNGEAIQVSPLQWHEPPATVPMPSIGNRIFAPLVRTGG